MSIATYNSLQEASNKDETSRWGVDQESGAKTE